MTRDQAFGALSHQVRRDLVRWALKQDGPWSPKMAHQALGLPLPNVSYHVKILREHDGAHVVREIPRRGAVEHMHTLTPTGRRYLRALLSAR